MTRWNVAARLLCTWNIPGKNTGVGSHFLSQESSRPRDWTQVSCIAGRFFTIWATREGIWCREPAWRTLPTAKVMRKEARHTQRWDRASGVPLEILEHLPPKAESAYFTALCSHLNLWLYRGLSPTTSFGERVNLELQLIIIPERDRSVSTYKLLWRFSSLPDRLVRPHVIVHSLPTMRGTRCFKPSKNRFFREVRKLLV